MKYENKNRLTKVGERGQVTIPKHLRDSYGVRPGDEVLFEEHVDGLLIRKQVSEDPLRALFGKVEAGLDVDCYLEESRGPAMDEENEG